MFCKHYTLITGASQGLGKYLALEGAQRGWNLVLIALPGSGLPELSRYLTKQYNVTVIILEKDLCEENACTEIFYELRAKGVFINRLINNAGMGGSYAFNEKDTAFFSRQITLNVTVPTLLARLFLDDLRKTAPSSILNVSSLACFFDLPSKQVYGGTKSYLLHFSKSLRNEVKDDGISVSVVCPGGMDTRWQLMMEHRLEQNWLSRQSILHPSVVARVAVSEMLKGKAVIIPGAWNKCFLLLNRVFPAWLKTRLTCYQPKRLKPVLVQSAGEITAPEAIAV